MLPIHWSMRHWPVPTPLKESSDSPTYRSHRLKSSIAGMWIGLILCVSFVGSQSFCEFMSVMALSCPKTLFQSCLTYDPKNLSAPSSAVVPEPWTGRAWYRCSLCGWTLHKQLPSAFWAGVRIFINHFPLYKETSLMSLQGDSNLQLLEIGI